MEVLVIMFLLLGGGGLVGGFLHDFTDWLWSKWEDER